MASTAVHIPDMLAAIKDGTVPGGLTADRSCYEFPTLAYLGARGATHYWTVRVRLLDGKDVLELEDWMFETPVDPLDGYRAEITVESLQREGKVRDVVPTYVSSGKNLGRKNATNVLTQAMRDALGMYNKHKKRADIAAADTSADTAASSDASAAASSEPAYDQMPPPQLVKKIGDSREATLTEASFAAGVTAQRKLNGVHLVAFMRPGGQLTFYSRTGREFPAQAHVATELAQMLAAAPAPTAGVPAEFASAYKDAVPYLAGELYLHGKSLNWISGQARRGDNDGELQYHVFDVFFPAAKAAGHDMESRHRQAYLDTLFARKGPRAHIMRVENTPVHSLDELNALAKEFLRTGYEGAIARKDTAGFRYSYSNYHSANVLKIKPIHDSEFPVVGFTQGTRGKDVGALIWECAVPNPVVPGDDRFAVVPKDMTYEERYCLFRVLSQPAVGADGKPVVGADGSAVSRFDHTIKGLPLTVEYAELSAKTGKPLQAKALTFRTYEDGPARDPARTLLNECLKN